jgi:hypothetical protein
MPSICLIQYPSDLAVGSACRLPKFSKRGTTLSPLGSGRATQIPRAQDFFVIQMTRISTALWYDITVHIQVA